VADTPDNEGVTLPVQHPLTTGHTTDSALLRHLRGERDESHPIWFMRQAGRSLPEYRMIREGVGMLDSCLTPELASEITLQPVRRHGVDAAIFFSDIVIPLKLAGLPIDIAPGVGPVLEEPLRSAHDIARLRPLDPDALRPIQEAVGRTVESLGGTPLIGFGGAPFTLASYLIEGGPSATLPHSRAMMREHPELWHGVLSWCATVTSAFIEAQVLAGASALQVFDSWAGKLSPDDYRTHALPHSTDLFSSLSHLTDSQGRPIPRVHFGVGTAPILRDMYGAGATVMGVDSETPLSEASALFGHGVPLQGNIRTDALKWPWEELRKHVDDVIREGKAAPGHVLNLGHGVPKESDPDVLTQIVHHVKGQSS
jgi:uroporphyrinogen decarboxylase